MPDGEMPAVVEFIHDLVVDPDLTSQTDRELLKRFLANRDENAFEALVRRHGPMVLALCRRILRDPQDVEDAFQAAFLVFVRRAASIARPELLGNWLYGVANRTARAARAAAEKRRVKEAEAVAREQPAQESPWQELLPLLDRELNRLPAKYRIPLVLCHLEDKSRQEAARTLGLPEGTLSSRLARGRALLAQRLMRWCPSVAGEVFLAGLGKQAIAAPLVQTTTKAGMAVLVRQSINTGLVSAQVAFLSQVVLRSMFMTKLKIAAAVLCVGSLIACAVGTAASWGFGTDARTVVTVDDSPAAAGDSKSPGDPLMNQVLETTKTITDAQTKLRLLLRIASVQNKTDDAAGARKTRREAFELAKGFTAGSDRVEALLTVAQSQNEDKDRTDVFETLKQAEQAVAGIEDENKISTLQWRLVCAQAAAGDYEGGLRTLAKGGSLEVHLFQAFGNHLNVENKEAARKALAKALTMVKFDDQQRREVKDGAVYLSPSPSNAGYGIAYAFVKAGDTKQALEVAAKMGKEQDGCLATIASAQAGVGDVVGAVRTSASIEQDDNKIHALNAIVDAQVNAGDLIAARSTLNQIHRLVDKYQQNGWQRKKGNFRQQDAPDPQLEQWQVGIAVTQLKLGDKSGAFVTTANIESDLGQAHALEQMGVDRISAGKRAEAWEMLYAASNAAQRASQPGRGDWRPKDAKAYTLCRIAIEQAKAGDVTEAFRTANTIPTAEAMDDALAGIAPAQAEAGDLKGAIETVARIRIESSKADALSSLAKVLARTGREKDALDLAAKQESPVMKARALLGVILGKMQAKSSKQESPK